MSCRRNRSMCRCVLVRVPGAKVFCESCHVMGNSIATVCCYLYVCTNARHTGVSRSSFRMVNTRAVGTTVFSSPALLFLPHSLSLYFIPSTCPPQTMLNYTHNAKLRVRFYERMSAYQCLWSGIGFMSSQYVRDAEQVVLNAYAFLSSGAELESAGGANLAQRSQSARSGGGLSRMSSSESLAKAPSLDT